MIDEDGSVDPSLALPQTPRPQTHGACQGHEIVCMSTGEISRNRQGDPSGAITRAFPWRENRWIDDWRVKYMIQYPTSMVTEWGTLDGESQDHMLQ